MRNVVTEEKVIKLTFDGSTTVQDVQDFLNIIRAASLGGETIITINANNMFVLKTVILKRKD